MRKCGGISRGSNGQHLIRNEGVTVGISNCESRNGGQADPDGRSEWRFKIAIAEILP